MLPRLLVSHQGKEGIRIRPARVSHDLRIMARAGGGSGIASSESIQREVQREHIDAWLAEHTECPSLGGRVYQLLHPCHGDAAGTRDPRKLVGRGGRRDVRIQTAAREK
jgi:hypothetical protein